ncbi:MAG: lipoate--protein ligase family protein [Acidimicrobiia bacterium]|nr:lipoate--protein ligase family protein [Acidimicrobiia bacterium]
MLIALDDAHPEPGLDTGISHALVRAVGEGRMPDTFRIHTTGRIVAFGRQDRLADGYPAAVRATRNGGYLPIERLAGGRAAVFHEGTLAFSWATATEEPRAGITERFTALSEMMAAAFRDVGADARVGELPGEYCPGAYSVGVGSRKVMGVGQRLVRGAAHVGGVIVVDGGRRIADILRPVYAALGIAWDPETAGDLCDTVPNLTLQDVAGALVARLDALGRGERGELPDWLVAEGRALAAAHIAPAA